MTSEDRSRAECLVTALLQKGTLEEWLTVLTYSGPWLAEHDPEFLFRLIAERKPQYGDIAWVLAQIGLRIVPC